MAKNKGVASQWRRMYEEAKSKPENVKARAQIVIERAERGLAETRTKREYYEQRKAEAEAELAALESTSTDSNGSTSTPE